MGSGFARISPDNEAGLLKFSRISLASWPADTAVSGNRPTGDGCHRLLAYGQVNFMARNVFHTSQR